MQKYSKYIGIGVISVTLWLFVLDAFNFNISSNELVDICYHRRLLNVEQDKRWNDVTAVNTTTNHANHLTFNKYTNNTITGSQKSASQIQYTKI